MGFYFRPLPWVKLRRTRRGWRAGIGPRWLRRWYGTGGRGTSTGWGPFSYYRADHRRHGPCAICGAGRGQPCRSLRDGRQLSRSHNGRPAR